MWSLLSAAAAEWWDWSVYGGKDLWKF